MRKDDRLRYIFTYIASSISVFLLLIIVFFVVANGIGLISFKLLFSNYHPESYAVYDPTVYTTPFNLPDDLDDDTYFSTHYGVALKDSKDNEGKHIIIISYMDEASPFQEMRSKSDDTMILIQIGYHVDTIIFDTGFSISRDGAELMVAMMDSATTIETLNLTYSGGGIRGSIVATLYLIGMTLLIALPVGILTAVYLTEVAKDTPINRMIKSLISMLTGVPSIIFGLMGAALFIPLTMRIMDTQGGSLISGALTMAVVVLPVIIKATEEALLVVPKSYKEASYGLGASVTQTTFKIVLPNAIPGILSATLLSIGRIIGESAALIYGIGTAIKDVVRLDEKATTLAVHIWSVMAGEVPNIELASAIAVILLITVFSLNLTIKMITYRYMKRYEGGL